MNSFQFYFTLGWQHIISWDAFDHLLFILALVAIYLLPDWRKVLILITAFTIGHSLTLALSVLDIIRFNSEIVEILIPVTIILTALINFFIIDKMQKRNYLQYVIALCFGLIHGMGFANSIRFMLSKNDNIALPLFSFNVGLEVGQIIIVMFILMCSFLVVNMLKLPKTMWVYSLSAIALCGGLWFLLEKVAN